MSDDAILFMIEGDASGAVAAFAEVGDALDALQEHLSAVMEQLGAVGDEAAGIDVIAASSEAADGAVATLNETLDATAATAEGAATALTDAGAATDALATSADATTASVGAQTDAVAANTAATDANTAAKGGNDAANASSKGSLGMLGFALAAAAAGFVYLGVQGQNSMNIVAALTGASAQQMQQYTNGVEQLSVQMGSSMKATADGLYYVVSAGFSGQGALNVLKIAMEDAAAGGANLSDVSNGLTSAMNAYGASANQATQYSDIMLNAVTYGKQTFSDFANSIGVAAVTGRTTGISFNQVAAAEATMTDSGLSAHRAVMNLDFTLRAVGLSTDKVATTAQGLGLAFDKTKYNSLDLIGKLEYLKQISGGNMAAFEKLVGGANGLTTAQILLAGHSKNYVKILGEINKGSGATSAAFKTHQQTMMYAVDKLGASLSVLAFQFVQLITPVVSTVLQGVANVLGFLSQHAQIAIPIVIALAAAIGGVLVVAIGALAAPLLAALAAAAPVIAIVAGVAAGIAVVAIAVKHFYDTSAPFRAAVQAIGHALQQAGSTIEKSLMPAWRQLEPQLQRLLPVLKVVGAFLGVILISVIGELVGVITGLGNALASIIDGISQLFAGLIQIGGGFVKLFASMFGGLFAILGDIIHGNGDALKRDALNMFQGMTDGIKQILGGIWNVIQGLWKVSIGAILAFIGGFVGGIIGFFQGLFNSLVGHSIIPDLVNGIVNFFKQLPGKVLGIIAGFVGGILGHIGQLKDQFLGHIIALNKLAIMKFIELRVEVEAKITELKNNALNLVKDLPNKFADLGQKIIDGLVTALRNGITKVGKAIGDLGQSAINGLKGMLGISSPSKVFAEMGTQSALGFAQGLVSQQALVGQAMSALHPSVAMHAAQLPAGALSAGNRGSALLAGGALGGSGAGAGARTEALLTRLVNAVEGGALGVNGGMTTTHTTTATLTQHGATAEEMERVAREVLAHASEAGSRGILRAPGGHYSRGTIGARL